MLGSISRLLLPEMQRHARTVYPCIFRVQRHGFHSSSMQNAKDYYSILGVSKNATQKDIKSAYFNLAKKHHPDANPGNKHASQKFQEISEAYRVLGDQNLRKNYDMPGNFGPEGFSNQSHYQTGFNPHSQEWPRHRTYTYTTNISEKEAEELFKKIFSEFGNLGARGFPTNFDVKRNQNVNSRVANILFGKAASALSKKLLEELAKQEQPSASKKPKSFWDKLWNK